MSEHPTNADTITISRETAEYLLEFIDAAASHQTDQDPGLLKAVKELEGATGMHFINPEPGDFSEQQIADIIRIHDETKGEPISKATELIERRILKEVIGSQQTPADSQKQH